MPDSYEQRDRYLSEMGYPTYTGYLASDLWKRIREKVLRRDCKICRLCGKEACQVHHKGYGRKVLIGSDLNALVSLCSSCHGEVEFDENRRKRSFAGAQTAYRRLLCTAKRAGVSGSSGGRVYYCLCGRLRKKNHKLCMACKKGKPSPARISFVRPEKRRAEQVKRSSGPLGTCRRCGQKSRMEHGSRSGYRCDGCGGVLDPVVVR
jgi:hypothetical protein